MGDTQTRAAAPRAKRNPSEIQNHAKADAVFSENVELNALNRRLRDALAECSILISSYRRLNADAGFPFRDPPRALTIKSEIDLLTDSAS